MSIREQIINGTYNKESSIRNQIINGTYKEKSKKKNYNDLDNFPTNPNYSKLDTKNYSSLNNEIKLPNINSTNKSNVFTINNQNKLAQNIGNNFNIKEGVVKPSGNGNLLDLFTGLGKTALTGANYLGQGIMKGTEGLMDMALDVSTSKANPYYWFNPDELGQHQAISQELIKKDSTHDLITNLSGDENFNQNFLDKGSLIKSDNLAGKVVTSIGQMLPSIATGGNLPGTMLLGAQSYGGGVEEAYNNGATSTEAKLYGLGSAATEIATEWITGGIPGTRSVGWLDNIVSKGLGQETLEEASESLSKEIIKYGYKVIGEGGEEALSEMINPLLKNLTYSENEKIDWNAVVESAIIGGLTGGILEAPANINNIKQSIDNNKNSNLSNLNDSQNLPQNNLDSLNNVESINNTNELQNVQNLEEKQQILPIVKNSNINKELDVQQNSDSVTIEQNNVDSNIFSRQVDEVVNGTFPQKNMLTVSENTPQILQDIGLNNLPITMTQRHLKTIMNSEGEYKGANYHDLGIDVVKQLPQAISNPLNILKSDTNSDSIVIITELADKLDRPIIASIKIDGTGTINDIEIDSNVLTSAYGRNNYDAFMQRNIAKGNLLYDIDEGIIKRSDGKLQLRPTTSSKTDIQGLQLSNNISSSVDNNTTNSTKSQIAPLPSQYSMQQNVENDAKIMNLNEISKLSMKDAITASNFPPVQKKIKQETTKILAPIKEEIKNTQKIIAPLQKEIKDLNKIKKELPKDPTREASYETDMEKKKKTRKTVQNELLNEMNITTDDLSMGNDINHFDMLRTDPIRLNEKVFGSEIGSKINDATIKQTKHNEAERTRFLNQERADIKSLGIKPRSKESSAVQKYGEKQYINQYGETVKYGDKELIAEFPDVKTREKIKRASSMLRNKYDVYIDRINSVITNMGYDEIPKRPDYMRHFNELNDKLSQWGIPLNIEALNENSLPTDINGITDQFRPGKNWFASAMKRTGEKTTYDAITGIDGYLEGASNLIYHTEDIQRYRALSNLIRDTFGQSKGFDNLDGLTEEQVQQRIKDIQNNKLSNYVAWLDQQANSLAGKKGGIDRAAERLLGRKVYSVLDSAKKQVGSNMTGFNVRSALTNFASAIQSASKTNKLAFVRGTISTINNIIHNDGLINKSDFLTSRFGSDSLSPKLWQKLSNAGQIFMKGSDYFTANQIWRSKFYENLYKGMNESEAIKNADDFSSRIMGDRSKGSTAEIFNSKTLGLLTQFQLEVNNQWSSLIHDNKMDLKKGNKSGASVLFQLGQLSAMSYLFNNFMKSLTGSSVMIDPIDLLKKILGIEDEDKEKTIEERTTEVLGDLVNNMPFASFLTGGRIPISEAFTGLGTFTKKITGQTDKYGNEIKWEDVKDDAIASAFYWLLPTGYGQLKKTVKGVSMYSEDKEVSGSYTDSGNLRFTADESLPGKIKALFFGEYSNSEAQKYIESNYKTINKSKINELKQLNMSSSEYRKYREGLVAAGTTNESKIDYIVNLDNVTNEQKNIMASNLLSREFNVKEYKKYNSYDEYNCSYNYPEKYSVITKITSYDKYNKYKTELKNIRDNTTNDKTETINYINNLKLSIPQKAMFIKMYYPSFNDYNEQIINYINSQKITKAEKTKILTELGFKIENGRVMY